MNVVRKRKLQRNSALLFWSRSFLNIKVINAVLSLFYAARGLSDSQIIWVSLFWAIATLLFEIPSSYMADRWGRKPTLLIGAIFALLQWVMLFFADGFWWVAGSMLCYGMWSACFSGTDIALLYDSKKELGEASGSLKSFGIYESSRNLLKIGSVLVGVFIAKDLTQGQFQILLSLDILFSCMAIGMLCFLTEPDHTMDVEKQEAGVLLDAWQKLKNARPLQRAILNKVLLFLVAYVLWTYYQKMYVGLGVSVLMIGVGWSCYHLITFFVNRHIHVLERYMPVSTIINRSVGGYAMVLLCLIALYYAGVSGLILYGVYVVSALAMTMQTPLYTDYFNMFSYSYNRATMMSLTNLLHNVLEIPILLLGGWLVAVHEIYPYIFAAIVAILLVVFVRVPPIRTQPE